jgi:hypothetical protein
MKRKKNKGKTCEFCRIKREIEEKKRPASTAEFEAAPKWP